MNKKLLSCLITIATVALIYGFMSIDRSADPFKEEVIKGREADTAKQFANYIYNLAKENRNNFSKRFANLPNEEREYVYGLLVNSALATEAEKVTRPASCPSRLQVYLKDKDSGNKYCFEVSNKKNVWTLEGLKEIRSE